jgi:hypothetical protein
MKLNKILFTVVIFGIFLHGCTGIKETLSNKKKANSDEFMVKKKNPLILPPEFDDLPKPQEEDVTETITQTQGIDLSKVLTKSKDKNTSKNKNTSNSIEKSISEILNKN